MWLSILITSLASLQSSAAESARYEKLCGKDATCEKYYLIWKKNQLARNGYDESYFNRHIFPKFMEVAVWDAGESFNIIYDVKISWASATTSDGFLVKFNPKSSVYSHLKIPKGQYFTEKEVSEYYLMRTFNSSFTHFKPVSKLSFSTEKSVFDAIARQATGDFKFSRLEFVKLTAGSDLKTPTLVAYNEENCEKNSQKMARVNLITGEMEISSTVCRQY